jgi:hypothetical protein
MIDDSAPNHDAGIDPLTALGACGDAHRDLSLLTEGTYIRIDEQLNFSTQSRPALRAGHVFEFEVPHAVTFWTSVVGGHLDLATNSESHNASMPEPTRPSYDLICRYSVRTSAESIVQIAFLPGFQLRRLGSLLAMIRTLYAFMCLFLDLKARAFVILAN